MKKALYQAASLTLLLVVACVPNKPRIDTGLFSQEPCGVPCWQNLTPGVSTLDDVNRFIEGLDPTDWPGRFTHDYPACRDLWVSRETDPIESNEGFDFAIEKGSLTFIEVWGPELPDLEQVVHRLGPPEYFESVSVAGPEGNGYSLEIYYPKQGVAFSVPVTPEDAGSVRPEMKTNIIEYFPPGDLTSYLTNRYSCDYGPKSTPDKVQRELSFIQPWTGFGQVKTIVIGDK